MCVWMFPVLQDFKSTKNNSTRAKKTNTDRNCDKEYPMQKMLQRSAFAAAVCWTLSHCIFLFCIHIRIHLLQIYRRFAHYYLSVLRPSPTRHPNANANFCWRISQPNTQKRLSFVVTDSLRCRFIIATCIPLPCGNLLNAGGCQRPKWVEGVLGAGTIALRRCI